MKQFVLLFCLFSLNTFAQNNESLNAEERAYLFHIVKKSPILNNSIGRYFDYVGPKIQFNSKEINYDSVELLIINQPDLLLIRRDEISKSPKGILAEAANKMAIWELNKVLLAKRTSEKELELYLDKYQKFEYYLLQHLPPAACKEKDGSVYPNPKIETLFNPSLALNDKIALVETMRFLEPNDALLTLEAINQATNAYVKNRALETYRQLGGKAEIFENVLVAAGDGSSTSGLLEEREKDEKGRWNKGLPKAVGLFPYQLRLEKAAGRKEQKIEPSMFTITDFETVGSNKITNIHLDVWGYNAKKQTTVVLEKNSVCYPLFGAADTRFLSPDSSFSEGATFQAILNDLEKNKIGKIHENIYGKRGFDYWIAYNKSKKDDLELKIEINEKKYSDLTLKPIKTKSRAPKSVRKAKRKARSNSGGPANYLPKQVNGKKDKRALQNTIVEQYSRFEAYKRKIAELEKQKAQSLELLTVYEKRRDYFKRMIGYNWATYTEKDGLYTFQDSSTFDMITQEFQFPASAEKEKFEIRLIAIPESSLSNQADEVMLHMHLVDAIPNYSARLQLTLVDAFDSDSWELNTPLFTTNDSVALLQFFEGLLDKKIHFSIVARGQGIGNYDGCRVVKNSNPIEENSYPGNTEKERIQSKMDSTYSILRRSELFVHMGRDMTLEINSYTDPVSSSLKIDNLEIAELAKKYALSKNDVLSAYRTATLLKKCKDEINLYAGTYLPREKAKIVIDRFNKEWNKTKIGVGKTSIPITTILKSK